MYVNEYQKDANRTLIDKPNRPLTEEETMLIWNAVGLTGEAGEVADSLKKSIFHEQGINRDQIKKELGDVMWYIAAICKELEFTLEEVAQSNIDKCWKRYPNGFTPKDSKERKDLKDE